PTTLEDAIDVARSTPPKLKKVCRVRHQPAALNRSAERINRGQTMFCSELNNPREEQVYGRIVGHNEASDPRICNRGKRRLQVGWSRWEDGYFQAECLRHWPQFFDHPDNLRIIGIP